MDEYKFKDLLAEETEASEQSREEAPAGKGERPNRRNRSIVFSVRLNHDEVEALQALADRANLPASTLARSWLVERIRREENAERVEVAYPQSGSFVSEPKFYGGGGGTHISAADESEAVRSVVRQELALALKSLNDQSHSGSADTPPSDSKVAPIRRRSRRK